MRKIEIAFALVGLFAAGACNGETQRAPDAQVVDAGLDVNLDVNLDAAPPDTGTTPDAGPDCSVVTEATELREMVWVVVPAGSFEMGCSPGDDQCYTAESPVHTVSATAFEINETEITQHQYESLTGFNPSGFSGCPNCPVEEVGWTEASAFCEALGARLPSEAEWEYAARGGSTSIYGCGDDVACLDSIAWYRDNSCYAPHPVATKAPNGFGLYDMQGNVWEWAADCWHNDYSDNPPNDATVWEGGDCDYRILRGGAYGVNDRGLRTSNRDGDFVGGYLVPSPGLRCVRDITAP